MDFLALRDAILTLAKSGDSMSLVKAPIAGDEKNQQVAVSQKVLAKLDAEYASLGDSEKACFWAMVVLNLDNCVNAKRYLAYSLGEEKYYSFIKRLRNGEIDKQYLVALPLKEVVNNWQLIILLAIMLDEPSESDTFQ